MYFKEKLKLLMELFKISNSQLARAINVDASLVSRWRSGQRSISASSPHIAALANYFMQLNAYEYQRAFLDQLIQTADPELPEGDLERKKLVLSRWLSSNEMSQTGDPRQSKQLENSSQFISGIARFLSAAGIEPREPTDPAFSRFKQSLDSQLLALDQHHLPDHAASQPDQSEPAGPGRGKSPAAAGGSQDFQVTKHYGHAGRRQAVIQFLRDALRSSARHKIYLMSEDKTEWMLEDRTFTYTWAILLKQVIEQGHDITIIHMVDRNLSEIMGMMQYWMPLHLSGRLHSYYLPRQTEKNIRQTQFIIAGSQALVCQAAENRSDQSITLSFFDQEAVGHYEANFLELLKNSRPLFTLYAKDDEQRLLQHNLDISRQPGSLFNLREQLNPLTFPEPLTCELFNCKDGAIAGDRLTLLQQHQKIFYKQIADAAYIDIYPLKLLEKALVQGELAFSSQELFMEEPLPLNAVHAAAWLEHLVWLIVNYPHYQVHFSNQVPRLEKTTVNISYKEYVSARFVSPGSQEQVIIRLDESNILHALSYYFEDLIERIPAGLKRQEDVIDRLSRAAARLQGESRQSASCLNYTDQG